MELAAKHTYPCFVLAVSIQLHLAPRYAGASGRSLLSLRLSGGCQLGVDCPAPCCVHVVRSDV
eukprot:3870030-Pyramimonas_sp.AAC.1